MKKSKTVIKMEKEKIYLCMNQFASKVIRSPLSFLPLLLEYFRSFFYELISMLKHFVVWFVFQVPIMAVMKAMGMESDQEVVQMLGRDPRYSALLLPSIEVTISSTPLFEYLHGTI